MPGLLLHGAMEACQARSLAATSLGLGGGLRLPRCPGWTGALPLPLACTPGGRGAAALRTDQGMGGEGCRRLLGMAGAIREGGGAGRQPLRQQHGAARRAGLELAQLLPGEFRRNRLPLRGEGHRAPRGGLSLTGGAAPPPLVLEEGVEIRLHGRDLTPAVLELEMRLDRESPHAEAVLRLAGEDAATALARLAGTAEAALEIVWAGQRQRFLALGVEREAHLVTVRCGGESLLLDGALHAKEAGEISLTLETFRSARAVASELLEGLPGAGPGAGLGAGPGGDVAWELVWAMPDFLLPPCSLSGTPMALLRRLASAGGGLARGEGARVRVEPRWPVCPLTLPLAQAGRVVRPETDLLALETWDVPLDHAAAGAATVQGWTPGVTPPRLAVEAGSGERVARVHWLETPPEALEIFPHCHGGTWRWLEETEEAVTERLEFRHGQAVASFPVARLDGPARWLGENLGQPVHAPLSERLLLSEGGNASSRHGLADVRYLTRFRRLLIEATAPEVLLAVETRGRGGVAVTVRSTRRPEAAWPDMLEEPLAGDPDAAARVGEAWLLGNALPLRGLRCALPADRPVSPGEVLRVLAPELGVVGSWLITRVTLRLESGRRLQELEGLAWR